MSSEAVSAPVTPAPSAPTEAPAAPAGSEAARMAAALAVLSKPAAAEAPASASEAPTEAPAEQPLTQPEANQASETPAAVPASTPLDPMVAMQQKLDALQAHIEKLTVPKPPSEAGMTEAERAELVEWRKLRDVGKYEFNKVLDKLGLTPEDIVAQAPNGGQLTPEQRRLQELQARLDAFEKRSQETLAQQQKAQQAALERQFVDNLRQQAAQSTKHDLVRAMGDDGIMQVKAVMEKHYLDTQARTGRGEELSFEQAADVVEAALEKTIEERLAKAPKFKQKWGGTPPSAPAPKPTTPKTLTGNMAGATKAPAAYDADAAYATALEMLRRK